MVALHFFISLFFINDINKKRKFSMSLFIINNIFFVLCIIILYSVHLDTIGRLLLFGSILLFSFNLNYGIKYNRCVKNQVTSITESYEDIAKRYFLTQLISAMSLIILIILYIFLCNKFLPNGSFSPFFVLGSIPLVTLHFFISLFLINDINKKRKFSMSLFIINNIFFVLCIFTIIIINIIDLDIIGRLLLLGSILLFSFNLSYGIKYNRCVKNQVTSITESYENEKLKKTKKTKENLFYISLAISIIILLISYITYEIISLKISTKEFFIIIHSVIGSVLVLCSLILAFTILLIKDNSKALKINNVYIAFYLIATFLYLNMVCLVCFLVHISLTEKYKELLKCNSKTEEN